MAILKRKSLQLGQIYDFESLYTVIKESRSKPVEVLPMQMEDFRIRKSEKKLVKLALKITDAVEVKFVRGHFFPFYKLDFGEEFYSKCEFL